MLTFEVEELNPEPDLKKYKHIISTDTNLFYKQLFIQLTEENNNKKSF